MAFQLPPAIQLLFGSETRAKVLGLLANSSEPRTGYELSKALEANVSKVYGVLRRLEGTGFLGVVSDRSGYKRFFLADENLRRFLLTKVRISMDEDWLGPKAVEGRGRRIELARRVRIKIPAVRTSDIPPDMSEFVRPPEKDVALKKVTSENRRRLAGRRRE